MTITNPAGASHGDARHTVTDLHAAATTAKPDRGRFRGAPDRWQPSRAGLLNVWQYDDEVLEFENGRLVLFGANGSGKTMALELLFPYLLDANASPSRLSTAGGNERGGLWSRVSGYDESTARVGYLWAEFTRTLTDGTVEHFTCGTRLAAKPGGGGSHCWFTTSQRVGAQLDLLAPDRAPLTPQALRDAVRTAGTVWGDDAGGYRNAVRTALYGEFSVDAYQSLIDGLLAVRKQSITDGLTPARLNQLLTDGLPGLDHHELDHVARGFEHLDSRRDTIANLAEAVDTSRKLARRVRTYSRSALRLVADEHTNAQTRLDRTTRKRNAAARELDATSKQLARIEGQLNTTRAMLTTLDVREAAVRESAGFASIAELEHQRNGAQTAHEDAERAEGTHQTRAEEHEQAAEAAGEARKAAEGADIRLKTSLRDLGVAGRDANITPDTDPAGEPRTTTDAYRSAIELRETAISEVRERIGDLDGATRDRNRANETLDTTTTTRDGRIKEQKLAVRALDTAVSEWAGRAVAWAAASVELAATSDTFADDIAAAAGHGDTDTFAQIVVDAHEAVSAALTREAAQLEGRIEELEGELDAVTSERNRLLAEPDAIPPFPAPWRSPRDPGTPGAALWELLDTGNAEPDALAGIEAALDAAGLLDAWIHPDRSAPQTGDITARAATDLLEDGTVLADILAVDEDAARNAGIDPADVTAVLATIAYGWDTSGDRTTVDATGRFRYGPAVGAASPKPASHIGTAARERARNERLESLAIQITELTGTLDGHRRELATIHDRADAARKERTTAPAPTEITKARRRTDLADSRVEDAHAAVAEAEAEVERTEGLVAAALRALHQVASTAGLPTTTNDLDSYARRLRLLRDQAGEVDNAASERNNLTARAEHLASFAAARELDATAAETAAEQARTRADKARDRYEQLERSVGADAQATAAELATITNQRGTLEDRAATLETDKTDRIEARATAQAILNTATTDAAEAGVARDEATVWFLAAVDAGLADDAGVDIGDEDLSTVTGVLNAVRAVNREVTVAADGARLARELDGASEERFKAQKTLAGRAELSVATVEAPAEVSLTLTVSRFFAVVDGTEMAIPVMTERFAGEHDQAAGELAEAEAALFEDIFAGSLRTHLASRLRAAQHLVDSMNDLLAGIRSASGGVAVSLRWDVDDDVEDQATLARIKGVLLRDHHSAEDRELLHGFLTRRIDQVRHDDRSVLSWRDALEALFDYRRWHTFRVMVRHDRFGERAVAFSSRKVSLSAGEKALVLSLPLFAAVASHYMPRDDGGAARTCPRLLLLDEVFPKNDRANKRQILGLLRELDLDCVLTSDKDRCDYDTVDGIAIAVISKLGDMSYSTRLVWNGRELTEAAPTDLGGGYAQGQLV